MKREVHENLFILYGKLHIQVISSIRRNVRSVVDLDAIQLYMKFKLEILEIPILERPNESSWAFVFLLVFMPESIHWIAKERFEKI